MAFEFDGADSVISTVVPEFPADFSFSGWVWRDGAGEANQGRIWQTGFGHIFYNRSQAGGDLTLQIDWTTDGVWRWGIPTNGVFHHFGLRYEGSAGTSAVPELYIDGELQSTTEETQPTGTEDIRTTEQTIVFGNNDAGTPIRTWDGRLAEYAFWTRVLTVAEIAALAKGVSALAIPVGCMGYWPMIRDAKNLFNNTAPTTNALTVVPHPRIIYPKRRRIWSVPAAAADPVIAADAGTYTVTGTAASLEKGSAVVAEAGSYAITGTAAALHRDATIAAESGSITLTGSAAGLTHDKVLTLDAGSYAVSGQVAGLSYGFSLVAEAGAYTLTGGNAALEREARLVAESASYTLTGFDATLTHLAGLKIVGEAGAYSITGAAAALLHDALLGAAAVSYAISGTAAALLYGRRLEAEAGGYAFNGTAASLEHGIVLPAATGSYALTGADVLLIFDGVGQIGYPTAARTHYARAIQRLHEAQARIHYARSRPREK